MKTIRKHFCPGEHSSLLKFAKCAWYAAKWVDGYGRYVALGTCVWKHSGPRRLGVKLHETLQEAEDTKKYWDERHQGRGCEDSHQVLEITYVLKDRRNLTFPSHG